MTDWDENTAVAEMPVIKLFGKWSSEEVQVSDISLNVSGDFNLLSIIYVRTDRFAYCTKDYEMCVISNVLIVDVIIFRRTILP